MLAMTGSMHTNSDINRLYLTRKKGSRDLQCIADIFDTRLVHLAQHVEDEKEKGNWLMNAVWQHEQKGLIKVAEGIASFYLNESQEHLENVKDAIKNKAQEMHKRNREERKVHSYLKYKLNLDENIGHTQTNKSMNYPSNDISRRRLLDVNSRTRNNYKSSQKSKRKDSQKKAALSPVCHQKEENIFHIVCFCTGLSSSMYLPIRHNPIAKAYIMKSWK